MKLKLFALPLAGLVAAAFFAACTKGGSQVRPGKPSPTTDSVRLGLVAGVWALEKVEYPRTATDWGLAGDSFNSRMTLLDDGSLSLSDNGTATNSGTWKLSPDETLLTLSYAGETETDTLSFANQSTLRLVVPQQMSYGVKFYDYYRKTFVLVR